MLVNPFANTGTLSAFNVGNQQNAPAALPRQVQAYQPQTQQAVKPPEESSSFEEQTSGYDAKGSSLASARGGNIDITV